MDPPVTSFEKGLFAARPSFLPSFLIVSASFPSPPAPPGPEPAPSPSLSRFLSELPFGRLITRPSPLLLESRVEREKERRFRSPDL